MLKKIFYVIPFATFLTLLVSSVYKPEPAHARGLHYWAHKIAVSTTAIDSHFTIKWQRAVISTDTVALFYKIGSPDTNGWNDRDFMYLPKGATLTIGPKPTLTRLEFKAELGSGNLYLEGYKNKKQR